MNLLWTPAAWDDYLHWQANDLATTAKINALLRELRRTPLSGLGKPEPLKGKLTGWWSRRITAEHRLVYRVTGSGAGQRVEVVQCRFHC